MSFSNAYLSGRAPLMHICVSHFGSNDYLHSETDELKVKFRRGANYFWHILISGNRNSVVSIVKGYTTDDLWFDSRQEQTLCITSKISSPALGAH